VEDLVTREARGGAAILTLNRPDKRNALSRDLITSLSKAFTWTKNESAVRCVVLTGAGPTFCAGMDLAELAETITSQEKGNEPSKIWHDALRLAHLYDLIYTMPKPIIAAVNGAAVAGGAGLVTVCDLAVAVPEARFGYPEVRRGLVAAMVMPHLLRLVGERAARYLLLTGELIEAQEAVRIGFINSIASDGRVLDQALNWANFLCQGGPEALARTKDLLRQFSRQALSVEEAAQASASPRLGEECRLGLQAFFDKKPAPWTNAGMRDEG